MATKTQPEKLPAISIRQPWALLIMLGVKALEYRSKPTKIRGPVYIYASLGMDLKDKKESIIGIGMFPDEFEELPRGVILGKTEIIDCWTTEDGEEHAWVLGDVEAFEDPLEVPEGVQPQPGIWYPFGKP